MSRTSRTLSVAVVATLAIMLGLSVQARQGQTVDPALKKAADGRIAAREANDADTYAKYVLDDAYFANADGVLSSKPERIKALKSGDKPLPPVKVSEDRYRMLGDTAIRTYRQDGVNAQGQKTASRWLEVWAKQAGEWKLAAVQFSNIAKP